MMTTLFYAFAALAIASALLVASLRNIARALFLFFIVLFALAALYVFALADFVAITQILVYVGGVLILMIFAFMLSNSELLDYTRPDSPRFIGMPNIPALLLSLGFLAVISYGIWEWNASYPSPWMTENIGKGAVIQPADNTVHQLGLLFMSRYLLPFEVISILLLVTLIGAAHMARKGDES